MLVLVAGVTGNIGKHLINSLVARGHQVRGLGRNASKLEQALHNKLHSFVEIKAYNDIKAIDDACLGVDAIVTPYNGTPEMLLDAQLILLRAAERAGVTKFVAATWNYDWRKLNLGDHESYDPNIAFSNHVELSSDIKPNYIFTGVLAEVLFSVPGHGEFSPKNNGVWDPQAKSMEVWGTGKETWHWTTERDAADFAAVIISKPEAAEWGFWTVCSGEHTLEEIARVYEKVKSREVRINKRGTVEELRRAALQARKAGTRQRYWEYIGWFYQLYTVDRTYVLEDLDNHRLSTKATSIEEFLTSNDSI